MHRDEFIRRYVIQFCASYVANNYDQNCREGLHEQSRKPPVEDAIHLAEAAWELVKDLKSFKPFIAPPFKG